MINSTEKQENKEFLSYCQERLNLLGISENENLIVVSNTQTFAPDQEDNIVINYVYENGQKMKYERHREADTTFGDNTFKECFYRKRLKNPSDGFKYWQPSKSGVKPFLNGLYQYFIVPDQLDSIQTLCLVEGEFKAFAGCKNGIACIGIGGIQNFGKTIKNEEGKTIEAELLQDIRDCIKLMRNLKNLVILHDADALNPSKDGTKNRQIAFYSSLKNFRLATKDLKLNVWYSHINTSFQETAKGLDDLLILGKDKNIIEGIIFNFSELKTGAYFTFLPLNKESDIKKLHKHFGLAEQASDKYSQPKEPAEATESQPRFIKIRNYLFSRYDLRLNTIANALLYKKKEETEFKELNENDLQIELYELGFKGFDKELSALVKSSIVPEYNPFKEYFENLPTWKEGDKDYINHLASFVVAKHQDWFNTQFKKMLVRSVACGLEKIPFNKHCFTLFGKAQNQGKTSFLEFLMPQKLKNYFKGDGIDFRNKDGKFALYQNLFINIDELQSLGRDEINHIKAFFTISQVKDRLPFDKKPSIFPRRASFFATTNEEEFLTDTTGNVRWLIFPITEIKHDKGGRNGYNQNVDIDLVYSQAFALLKSGFDFTLSKEDIAYSENQNRTFQKTTPEIELIARHYAPATKDEHDEFVTSTDVLSTLSTWYPFVKLNSVHIGRAFNFLQFEKVQLFIKESNYQRKGYFIKWIEKK
jgi:hypothetical protein